MTSAVAAARVALTPFEPSDAAVVSWQQLGSRTEANGGRVAQLQADADKFVELCKTAGPLLETICAELGDRAEEIDELGDHADRHDQSALVSSLEALVGAFSAADGGSEAARTREFTKYASDIKEQRARRMTAAAAVVITNRPAADDAEIIAALESPDSDLATLPAKPNGQDVHLDTSAVSELASSVARDAAKVFRAHNLGADRAAVVRDAYQKLNAVWKQSRNGPLLPIHDTAPAASRLEAQKRSAADQHAHQVRWVVEIQKVECRDPQPFFATTAPCRLLVAHTSSLPLTPHPPPPAPAPRVCADETRGTTRDRWSARKTRDRHARSGCQGRATGTVGDDDTGSAHCRRGQPTLVQQLQNRHEASRQDSKAPNHGGAGQRQRSALRDDLPPRSLIYCYTDRDTASLLIKTLNMWTNF